MTSDMFKPTEGQLIRDRGFLDATWSAFVIPLVEELASLIPGFVTMDWEDRIVRVVELNEPYIEIGDSLMLGHMPVYAGRRLGQVRSDWIQCAATGEISHKIERYVQRFSNDYLSTLWRGRTSIADFLHEERDEYESLPPSYKAALLALYVLQNVNVAPDEASAFVMGVDKGITYGPRRAMAFHTFDNQGRCSGWIVRLRDCKPPQQFAIQLASFLRNTTDDEAPYMDFETHKGKRRTNEKSEIAFEYIENLLAQGVVIGRGGSLSWDEVAARLSIEYGNKVRAYTGDNLRDCFRKYKQRTEGE